MRFIIDAQLPPALCEPLRLAGHVADHVSVLGMIQASDRALWQWAKEQGAAIISKDEDFLNLSALNDDGPFIVWIRIGNCSNQHLTNWLLPRLAEIQKAAEAGDKLIELI